VKEITYEGFELAQSVLFEAINNYILQRNLNEQKQNKIRRNKIKITNQLNLIDFLFKT